MPKQHVFFSCAYSGVHNVKMFVYIFEFSRILVTEGAIKEYFVRPITTEPKMLVKLRLYYVYKLKMLVNLALDDKN